MRKFIYLFLLLILSGSLSNLYAVKAFPEPVKYQQSDGSMVRVKLHGDEFLHWAKSSDGYTLIKNQQGDFVYAIVDNTNKMIPSSVLAHNPSERDLNEFSFLQNLSTKIFFNNIQLAEASQRRNERNTRNMQNREFPSIGDRNVLLLIIEYPDENAVLPSSDFEALMNQEGYQGTGSFKDFYLASSYNQLNLTTTVMGWYTADNNMAYYGANNMWGNDQNPTELVREAVDAAEAAGVDFSTFDNDNDGVMDGIQVIHAGYGEEAGAPAETIWSHRWALSAQGNAVTYDGVYIDDYAIYPELRGNSGAGITNIGVVCHEFGHSLGLPDFYDTDYSGSGGQSFDLGSWDMMAGGSWNNNGITPANHNAWSKDFLGWLSLNEITDPTTVTDLPTAMNSDVAYKINSQTPNEYFILENRQQDGFDEYIPHHGLLIYHYDGNNFGSIGNTEPNHQCMDIEEADDVRTTATFSGDPFPGTNNVTSFTDETVPSMQSWSGQDTDIPITNITESNGLISFDVLGGAQGNPVNFEAAASATDIIDLSWQQNPDNDPVLLAWSSNGVFGTPIDGSIYSQGDVISGGGTVLAYGAVSQYEHTGLDASTTYYYKIWSVNGSSYSPGSTTQATTFCEAIGMLPVAENFSEQQLPSCWDNIDNEGSGQKWQFVDGSYQLGGSESFNASTAGNGYAVLDSDTYGSGNSQDADLVSPLLDLSAYANVTMSFEHYFRSYSSSTGTFSYSTNGGSSWTVVEQWTETSSENAAYYETDLSTELAGEANVKLKWNYTGTYAYYWAIDDISITSEVTCTPPSTQATDFATDNITNNEVSLQWSRGNGDAVLVLAKEGSSVNQAPINGNGYSADSQFGSGDVVGSGNYVVYNGTATSITITNLEPGTDYHFAVYEYFTGDNCYLTPGLAGTAATNGANYCESYAASTDYEYISNVTLETINNSSGSTGYSDYTGISTDLVRGQTYQITVTASDTYDTDEVWGWIDWNNNGELFNAGETIFFNYNAVSGGFVATANIAVPSDAALTSTLMRISLADGGAHSCEIFSYGEVEDYSINVADGTAEEYTVTFNVSDINTSDPISGAAISVNGNNLTTDVSGQATVSLVDGTYSYSVTASGYENTNGSITVDGADFTENVEMTPLPPEEYTVTFNVSDINTSDAISGAGVYIDGENLTSDASGQATISLADGTYNYSVMASGYESESGSVTVSGSDVTENVEMTPLPPDEYTLTFNVTDINTSDPIIGAEVSIDGENLTTDASGQATINLVVGTYSYSVTASGYENESGSVTVDGMDLTENVEMTPIPPEEFTVTFSVSDVTTSDPISGVEITIDGENLTTNASGEATISLANGTYNYSVMASGYESESGSVTVSGSDVTENVEMTPLPPDEYTLTFNVTDINTSDPIIGAEVSIDGENLTTDASGQATINLVVGTYSYSVTASGYENESGSVTVDGMDLTENVEMTPIPPEEFTVTFSVSDVTTSDPISGVEITIDGENLTTNASGEATISLANGTYNYSVMASGYESESGSVTVSGSDVTENVEMTPLPPNEYTLTFNVTDINTSDPIIGAEVSIDGENLTTDASGQATINLVVGTYSYSVTASDYENESGSVTVDGLDLTENVEMTPQIHLVTFYVSETESGNPIENAEVNIAGETLWTDADGLAEIALANGQYSYSVSAEGYLSKNGEVTVAGSDVNVDVVLDFGTGIEDPVSEDDLFVIYPNPASEKATFKWDVPMSKFRICIRNVNGKVIFDKKGNGVKTLEINLSEYAKGTYLVSIHTEEATYQRKLIIK